MQYQYQMRPNLYVANALNAFNNSKLQTGGNSIYKKINLYVLVVNIAIVYGIASFYYILMTAFIPNNSVFIFLSFLPCSIA